ncbi:MAG: hypothetical protein GXP51_02660 [Deltaproteobacteria bacterium]|nr:hypothetical protein [Deltaproteobacteria bacterium]
MKKQIFVLMMVALLMIPAAVMAMKMMDGDMSKMSRGSSMPMGSNMVMLQGSKVDGITASAHLMDVKAKMAENGMSTTHHLMVGFTTDAGEKVSKGQVAVKIEAPDGKVSSAKKMMGMGGQFGVDLTLDQKGSYHFKIGTKLADGKKRVFHMHYENK